MNTKTMRLPPRRVVTSSNKRKEREGFDSLQPLSPEQPYPHAPSHPTPPPLPLPRISKPQPPAHPNQLLAGYLAHEFLTRGTLFGQTWEPARAEAMSPSCEPKRAKPSQGGKAEDDNSNSYRRYAEVSGLLKADGAHLPGIVNPTQLARFLQM